MNSLQTTITSLASVVALGLTACADRQAVIKQTAANILSEQPQWKTFLIRDAYQVSFHTGDSADPDRKITYWHYPSNQPPQTGKYDPIPGEFHVLDWEPYLEKSGNDMIIGAVDGDVAWDCYIEDAMQIYSPK